MIVINNQEEYKDFFPYANKESIKEYPTEYPCVCKVEIEGGGLMGDYRQVYVIYFPKDVSIEEAFLLGLKSNWKKLK
jgi:hypothetical protein